MTSSLVYTLVGAVQASFSVLLVIFYGVLAAQYGLLDTESAKRISHVSVKLFLPFLLITKVGKELNVEIAINCIPVALWTIFFTFTSLVIGRIGVRVLGLPSWVTPAVAFNNTTSLPLLLIQSFQSTGILDPILKDHEDVKDAIVRAQSYFLVCSVVSKCLTFTLGPVLLDGDEQSDGDDEEQGKDLPETMSETEDMQARLETVEGMRERREREEQEALENGEVNETTSLLPDVLRNMEARTTNTLHDHAHAFLYRHRKHPDHFSTSTRKALGLISGFFNNIIIGAVIGFVLGLVPPLHRAFFNHTDDGGIFTSWLTQSMRDTGDLFVTLQVIIVGVKLSSSLRRMKRGEDEESSGEVSWSAASFVFFVRYVFWALLGVPLICFLAKLKTKNGSLLDYDPTLWFSMMLMACGPPAMSLVPMADISGTNEGVKMSVAKLLTFMYGVSPVLALVIVGALKATETVHRG